MELKTHRLHFAALAFAVSTLASLLSAQSITLRSAIDSALKNNAAQRRANFRTEYLKRLAQSGADIPQTMVIGEYGQINSYFTDNKFTVSQVVRFPAVDARQRSVLHAEWLDAVADARVAEAELRKNVALAYFDIVFLEEKLQLLASLDSIFREFLALTEQRLGKGGVGAFDKAAAELQSGDARLQYSEAGDDLALVRIRLRALLNASQDYEPAERSAALTAPDIADNASLNDHVLLLQQERRRLVDSEKQRLERAKLLPDLFLAYNNMSMLGYGADGVLYGRSSRFQSVQAGIGVPLFYGAQRAKLSASRIAGLFSEATYSETASMLESSRREAWMEYEKNRRKVAYMEATALNAAGQVLSEANRQFRAGEIRYTDWASLAAQAIGVKSAYIDARRALNASVVRLNAFNAR
jgi:cobalt-zinc-cadmium resistance protein CzcA